jgi:O-antigen ligase
MKDNYKNILFFVVAAILIFSPIARGAVRLWATTPISLAICVLVFAWLWRLKNKNEGPETPKKIQPLDIIISLFVILAFISCFFSVYKYNSFYFFLRLLVFTGFYYLVAKNFDTDMKNRLCELIVILGTGLSIYGLLQYFNHLGHPWWYPQGFLASTYVNHNHFAGYLEMVIPISIGFLIDHSSQRFFLRHSLTAALLIMLAAFVLTQSRTGWVSLAIALLVMMATLVKKKKLKSRHIFVLILTASIILGFSFIHRETLAKRLKDTTTFAQGEEEASIATRLMMWKATLKMTRDNPVIGVGLGAFDSAYILTGLKNNWTNARYTHTMTTCKWLLKWGY